MQTTAPTKKNLREMAAVISSKVDGKGTHVYVGTWLDRSGFSVEVRFQSSADGRRIAIHKWDDEDVCDVRFIFGSFWRPRPNREGVEYGRVDNVDFAVVAISQAITTLVADV